jgi:hypothetical protein
LPVDDLGECHRRRPDAVSDNPSFTTYSLSWRSTGPNDWCYEGIANDGYSGPLVTFEDDFSVGWFVDHSFTANIFSDDFESGDTYETLLVMQELFDMDWFTNNTFGVSLMSEDFNSEWFVENDYSPVFVEDFETGGIW